ncbi:ATP-dependent zinc metalloprotease FtsH [Clostridium celatum]|uniref:ATP-dependent zinc metalloprotease FtsH n=1 Tax=Clostridium celatum DSM 1785 TaxID=545697 RepID=L1QM76_9CLOT|nr:ATP-dependent zinc metalloprotease FtsH [Clostridium celatum]EKY29099.1 ATP-dependent metallopeptidase HflB [Clostridium celatum DSM 1785]MCE9654347.1 ATP-dependent zinc metalloprotease FtsH [Clostridium celatum]MDU2265686.1 ATP-dependent zinc metalloprotease FtsH [Clostridium celatum]MDU3722987.1 ATP-dependent zinc metalloprotease FtsH [Clostridium celatum]MDU6295655.1 ATP-dependent zinc metalloprotease FtsH [Clostridium celatum]
MNNNEPNKKNGEKKKNNNNKFLIIYAIIAFLFLYSFSTAKEMLTTKEVSYNEFVQMVENKEIKQVTVDGTSLVITPQDTSEMKGKILYTGIADDPDLVKLLIDNNVDYYPEIKRQQSVFMDFIVINVLPLVLMFFLVRFIFGKMAKKMGGGPMGMGMGKSNAKVYVEKDIKVSFEDVAGQDEAKESLTEIIDFLHNPKRYTEIGAKLPKGALLVGPPGTGKTLIAKAVAGEAKVPFLSVSGSTFVEMFVGMGAAKVRDLFKEAEKMAPCIIFIDEIDSIGKSRDNQMQSNDEREQTLNQLLTEMDGFDTSKGIVILGATNRPEILDKALLRPGRFDRRVIVDRPDLRGRIAILNVHAKDVKMGEDVNLESIAKGTPGAVGADLANIINEAALRAVRSGRDTVIQEDLEEAVEVIIAGKEKKDRILSKKEREIVAFHEVGHALVAGLLEGTDPVHKITIVPRTMGALGYTMQLPEEEKYLVSKEELMNQITVMLGGRAAEEEVFNIVTTGASNDIERSTQTARNMVTIYGMTDNFDMMALESVQNRYLDGRAVRNCSEETSTLIDKEVLSIVRECHERARTILRENRDLLDAISAYLLEKETIFGDDFLRFIYEKYPELKEKREAEKRSRDLDLNKDSEIVADMEEAEEIIEAIEKEEETIIRESSSDEILDMNKSETESKEEKDNFNL